MASAIFVSGPTEIHINTGSGFSVLGESDNDNLPQITYTDNMHEIRTVSSGQAPEEIVVQNITATLTCTLVKWDSAIYAGMIADLRGQAYTATVGRLLVNDGGAFGVKIVPKTAGKTAYQFDRCYLIGDSTVLSQFGNVEQRLALTFKAIPNQSNILSTTSTT